MNPIGSSSVASQIYSGVQSRGNSNALGAANRQSTSSGASFQLPSNATPRGDWDLSENAPAQSFDANSQRGSYLNIVV